MAQLQYLLDTSMCIYMRRERPQAVLERFNVLPPGTTAISVITYGELVYRGQKGPDPRKSIMNLEELIALIAVVTMANDAAKTYGVLRSDLATRGELIGNNDLWVAAHAKSLGLTLVTSNERDFQRVGGLTVESWARDTS
jgi:tRNA(fMet)-specific endonuclease VapC